MTEDIKDNEPIETGESQSPDRRGSGSSEKGATSPVQRRGGDGSGREALFIVALGASAGGLETLETFFRNTEPDTGMAFVVIVHLDPDHKTLLPELLGRHTRMDVVLAEEGLTIEPNTVHIIPANRDMTISGGQLHLEEPMQTRGMRRTIDNFLRSLAEDVGDCSAAVILSGTGSDGTQGAKEIKSAGGLVLAQDTESAKYTGMPQSVIDAGIVDLVLPPDRMPGKLVEYYNSPSSFANSQAVESQSRISDHLRTIYQIVGRRTGHDLSGYKTSTMVRRIDRRMALNEIKSVEDYIALLREDPNESNALFREALIGVTRFFRDPEAFEFLEEKVIPRLFENTDAERPLRVWLTGCATGEEAYSVAILVQEYLQFHSLEVKVQIFATDIDQDSIDFARSGRYPEGIADDISEDRLNLFFKKKNHHYQVIKKLREMIVFAQHNLIKDPPFTKLDLLVCRNLLIYLNPDVQKKVMPLFYQALLPGGFLFLGTSETVGGHTGCFKPLSKKWKIFESREGGGRKPLDFPLTAPPLPLAGKEAEKKDQTAAAASIKPGQVAERILIQRYSPACVVINEKQEVLYYSTRTAQYLEPPVGEPTQDVLKMAREELRPALRAAVHKAFEQEEQAVYRNLQFRTDREQKSVNLIVEPLTHPPAVRGMALVIFESAGEARPPQEQPEVSTEPSAEDEKDQIIAQLEEQLRITHDQLQATTQRLETSNEELKSSNEELMSMNEEFQSTNEELETSKEELQALNEELVTVNAELENKVDELGRANNDLENLINSSEIATIFLDRKFRVKRFTPQVASLFNLIEADLGRPLEHISSKVSYPELGKDVEKVLETLTPSEREVNTSEDRHYLARVLPYRTTEDVIEGVVVTFIDITERRKAEENRARLAVIVEASADAIIGKTLDRKVISWNPGAEKLYGYTADEMVGRKVDCLVPPEQQDELEKIFADIAKGKRVKRMESERVCKDGLRRQVALSVSPIFNEEGEVVAAASISRDITDVKKTEKQLKEAKEEAEQANRVKSEFLANVSHEVRTPLTGIMASLGILEESGLDREQLSTLGMAKESSNALLRIIEDILDFAVIGAGKLSFVNEPFALRDWFEGAVARFLPKAGEAGVKLRSSVLPGIPECVVSDAKRLDQVLANLLDNAIKFTEEGRVEATLGPADEQPDEEDTLWLEITVSDTGIGIPEDKMDQLFDSFSQVDSSLTRKYGGTGLGLAISHEIVTRLGGELTARSTEGEGSVFAFVVPVATTVESPVDEQAESGEEETKGDEPSWKVLLVEDDPLISDVMLELFKHRQWRTTLARNGQEALDSCEDQTFDVILMDVQMPDLHGLEVTRRLRSREKQGAPATPIIALTAHAGKSDRERCLEAGMDEVLTKPVKMEELISTIREVVEGQGGP